MTTSEDQDIFTEDDFAISTMTVVYVDESGTVHRHVRHERFNHYGVYVCDYDTTKCPNCNGKKTT